VHTTSVFHGAGPNTLTQSRMIVGTTYFADGALMAREQDRPDFRKFCPGVSFGEPIRSQLNPLIQRPAS
jgi:hypothetical protein